MNPISCFRFLFHSSLEVESMSFGLPMNQKEIITYKHKLLQKINASSLVPIMNNIYLYPALYNVCIICSYHSNE